MNTQKKPFDEVSETERALLALLDECLDAGATPKQVVSITNAAVRLMFAAQNQVPTVQVTSSEADHALGKVTFRYKDYQIYPNYRPTLGDRWAAK
ncbi:hypothetical protein [Cognatishimia sp. MH4019]|uniref:hypothetical protein n=1 Tax=Cognatishimia sp. MH4019 TaxID=2854030 RepID=UPI001CD4F55E|nr:hypothetical protein [Cognatishimia sp. MH4019]